MVNTRAPLTRSGFNGTRPLLRDEHQLPVGQADGIDVSFIELRGGRRVGCRGARDCVRRLRQDGRAPRRLRVAHQRVTLRDAPHVLLRLAVRRHAPVLVNRAFARVVARERESHVAAETIQQPAHVARARFDVLRRVEDVAHAEARGGCGHQLHQAARALVRDGHLLERRLAVHDRIDEHRIDAVTRARFHYVGIDFRIARRETVERRARVHRHAVRRPRGERRLHAHVGALESRQRPRAAFRRVVGERRGRGFGGDVYAARDVEIIVLITRARGLRRRRSGV